MAATVPLSRSRGHCRCISTLRVSVTTAGQCGSARGRRECCHQHWESPEEDTGTCPPRVPECIFTARTFAGSSPVVRGYDEVRKVHHLRPGAVTAGPRNVLNTLPVCGTSRCRGTPSRPAGRLRCLCNSTPVGRACDLSEPAGVKVGSAKCSLIAMAIFRSFVQGLPGRRGGALPWPGRRSGMRRR